MNRPRIGILGYDGVAAINVVGPLEAFSNAFHPDDVAPQLPCYDVSIIGCTNDRFVTDTGVVFHAEYLPSEDQAFDTVIVPGGRAMRCQETVRQVADWLRVRADGTRRVASVCTGVYAIASTGLLDGHRVTTHWQHAMDVAKRFPKLQVEESSLVVKDGKFYSAAGATAGIDLALFLIGEDFGLDVALTVARKLLVYVQRDGGQEQYSEPPRADLPMLAHSREINTGRLGKLVAWISTHLADDLRLEMLAKRALLSKNDFIHQFTHAFGVPPALFVKNLRFNEARRRLMSGETPATVARSVGFADPAYFIQEFRRRFGMLPSDYQRRFGFGVDSSNVPRRRNRFAERNGARTKKRNVQDQRPRITSFTRCIRRHIAADRQLIEATT